MRRYFAPKVGPSAASKEALAMFKDKNKRTIVATHSRYNVLTTSRMNQFLSTWIACCKTVLHQTLGGPHQGNKLAEILQKEGSFEAMEIRVKQIVKDEETNAMKGGWHTQFSLKQLGWSEPMPQFNPGVHN